MTKDAMTAAMKTQANVIGALVLRELHTRFGRENIGYLWIFAEPMLLAAAVALLHSGQHLPLNGNIRPVPFAISGYVLFILFRSTVSRAETLLEANRPLLHHRQVTLFDMLAARALLEITSIGTVLFILLGASWLLGLAELPADFALVLAALSLIGWFSFGLSMLICALSHESPLAGRLVHPLLYLMLPLSGAFFSMLWLPAEWQQIARWIPLVPMFELLKVGMFEGYPDLFVDVGYAIAWCTALTLFGMLALKLVRPHIQVV